MKCTFSFLLIVFLLGSGITSAQMVGANAYLQGNFLEIGELNNGAFGIPPGCGGAAPAGYHPFPAGSGLAAVYDYGHDGWTVGTPPYFGDYTYPGTPFEGWELEVAGLRNQMFQYGAYCPGTYGAGGGTLTGSITSYSTIPGAVMGNWAGTAAGGSLTVTQETRVDANASWVLVTTYFHNTSSSAIPGVYYLRTCDPDNEQTRAGGFTTTNTIIYQNDIDHRVMVNSKGITHPNAYLALATKDCRAKAFVFNRWYPIDPAITLVDMYNQTVNQTTYDSFFYDINKPHVGDIAIGLAYNIGTIAPGDSAILTYAYIFSDDNGIDSAFPEPQLVVNGVPVVPTGPAPAPSIDTFNVCLYPGTTTIPVSILNGDDKSWKWSKWNWSPTTGLSSSTGITNTVNIAATPGVITYTITGTDSATNMYSCSHRVFYLTVLKCFNASSNSPGPPGATICEGDTLNLFALGDSVGATYMWYGPGTYTSTVQNPSRLNVAFTDTGLYTVIRTIGIAHDTSTTRVFIRPLPIVAATSNAPICSGNTLNLTVAPVSPGETFTWSGPNAFSSALSNPSVPAVPVSYSGDYKVVALLNGCTDSGYVTVIIDSTPAIPVAGNNGPLCSELTLSLTATDATAGVVYSWAGPYGWTSFLQNPTIPVVDTMFSHTFTVTATLGPCRSSMTTTPSITKTPAVPGVGSNTPICLGDSVKLISADATLGVLFDWVGPAGFSSMLQNPAISPSTFSNGGTYTVTARNGMCSNSNSTIVVVNPVPIPTAGNNSAICAGDTLKLFSSSSTGATHYNWLGPDYFVSNLANPYILHAPVAATGTYTVLVTLNGCSDTAITTAVVSVTPEAPLVSDTSYCQNDITGKLAVPGTGLKWFTTAKGDVPVPWPVPNTSTPGITTWYVSQSMGKCTGPRAAISATVYPLPVPSLLVSDSFSCEGRSVTFNQTGNGTDYAGITWDFGDGSKIENVNPVVHSYDGVGIFTVSATALHNVCPTTYKTKVVRVSRSPIINLGPDTSICVGSQAISIADRINHNNKSARWRWGSGQTNSAISVTQPGDYYTVVTIDGCTASDTVIVLRNCYIDVPNVFTPNGDGLNDYFFPRQFLSMGLTSFKMDIFNRWGQLVFTSSSIEGRGWDGTFNNIPQPEGVFIYTIDATFKDGKIEHHQGNITLLK